MKTDRHGKDKTPKDDSANIPCLKKTTTTITVATSGAELDLVNQVEWNATEVLLVNGG